MRASDETIVSRNMNNIHALGWRHGAAVERLWAWTDFSLWWRRPLVLRSGLHAQSFHQSIQCGAIDTQELGCAAPLPVGQVESGLYMLGRGTVEVFL